VTVLKHCGSQMFAVVCESPWSSLVGLLPDRLAMPLARLEPYGLAILMGVLFALI
jgi:hypothetical protein